MSDCSTHAFDVPLKPCPFCGGEARTAVKSYGDTHYWRIYCDTIGCAFGASGVFRTEAEAIAAWNMRHQCGLADEDYNILLDELGVSERTCKPLGTIRYDYEGGYAGFEYETELSCGHKWRDAYGDYPDYCPSCGAKVVGE